MKKQRFSPKASAYCSEKRATEKLELWDSRDDSFSLFNDAILLNGRPL